MEDLEFVGRRNLAMRLQAEELVRTQVLANILADLPPPSIGQKLAASHYELSSTVSPQALASRLWR